MDSQSKTRLYKRAGIDDRAEFYRVRYASDELLRAEYFDAINRFDIRWARTIWVYNNVRRGSSVLDLGCGSGVLALLKRKGITLIGVDLSFDCASIARRNGYDEASVADLTRLPFKDSSFDYVVSLDVLGHVEFDQKDQVIGEVRRVLKPEGVTLHGIECLDRRKRKDYEEMSEEELRQYIQADGHVGMEDQARNVERFRMFFQNVQTRFRFVICQSHNEFLKQSDDYGRPYCDPDFLAYLRTMSFKERRAFDMAMGYVFDKISENDLEMPQSEYLLLKASNQELGNFYNEHRDQISETRASQASNRSEVLDFSPKATFDGGWYPAESFPPIARWMGDRAAVSFRSPTVSRIKLQLQSHLPGIQSQPISIRFFLDGTELHSFSLGNYGWVEVELAVPIALAKPGPNEVFNFEIRADKVWQPKLADPRSTDDRELSIAVCNLEIFP